MRIAKQDIPVKFDVPGAVARQLPDFGDSTGFGTIDQASAFGWSEPAQHVGRRDTDDRSQHIRQEPVPENACSIEQLASLVRQDAQPTRHCTGRYRGQRTSGAELGQTCHLAHEQRVAAGATMEPRGLSAGSLRVHDPCDQFLDTIDGQALEVHVAGMGTERSDPRRGLVAELIVTVRADDQ